MIAKSQFETILDVEQTLYYNTSPTNSTSGWLHRNGRGHPERTLRPAIKNQSVISYSVFYTAGSARSASGLLRNKTIMQDFFLFNWNKGEQIRGKTGKYTTPSTRERQDRVSSSYPCKLILTKTTSTNPLVSYSSFF